MRNCLKELSKRSRREIERGQLNSLIRARLVETKTDDVGRRRGDQNEMGMAARTRVRSCGRM